MKTPVSVQRCATYDLPDIDSAIRSTLEPLGGLPALIGEADRVVIKTNLLTPGRAAAGHVTHPAVVEAVARLALGAGDWQVVIADSPAWGSAQKSARRCGVGAVAKRLNIEIWNLDQPTHVPLPAGEAEWREMIVDRRLIEPGTRVINLPKAKVHGQMYLTLAIKNLFGVITGKRKPIWHLSVDGDRRRFGRMLLWLHRVVQPAVHIIDCIDAMERRGPRRGDMRRVGLVAASPDAVALDRVITEILGLDWEKHHALQAAREIGQGAWDLDAIDVLGEAIETVRVEGFREAQESDLAFGTPRFLRRLLTRMIYRRFPRHS